MPYQTAWSSWYHDDYQLSAMNYVAQQNGTSVCRERLQTCCAHPRKFLHPFNLQICRHLQVHMCITLLCVCSDTAYSNLWCKSTSIEKEAKRKGWVLLLWVPWCIFRMGWELCPHVHSSQARGWLLCVQSSLSAHKPECQRYPTIHVEKAQTKMRKRNCSLLECGKGASMLLMSTVIVCLHWTHEQDKWPIAHTKQRSWQRDDHLCGHNHKTQECAQRKRMTTARKCKHTNRGF